MQQYLTYLCTDINETGPSLVIFLRVDQFYVLCFLFCPVYIKVECKESTLHGHVSMVQTFDSAKSYHTLSILQILFHFWYLDISDNILRDQNKISFESDSSHTLLFGFILDLET